MRLAVVAALSLFAFSAHADEPGSPPKIDDIEPTIVGGLKLIRDGKFDEWIKTYCSKAVLCTKESLPSLKRYNLPAMSRRAKHCLKEGDVLKATRREEVGKNTRLFITCEETAMPIPIYVTKEKGGWKFAKI